MLSPIFWKKVQRQKHPGRWEIAERQKPSIKMLFKTNIKGHKHPSIRLFIIEQDTISKPKKTKSGIEIEARNPPPPQKKKSPIECDGVQLHQYWTTLLLYVYMSYNRTRIKHAYIYIYILTQSFFAGTKVTKIAAKSSLYGAARPALFAHRFSHLILIDALIRVNA